jgi:hypothetical protein
LLLVGGEPAAFFLDACRLMDSELRLDAASHLVAHLLRELNAALRDVLRPMVADEDWPERGSDNSQVRQVNAICDALGVSADASLRVLWRQVVQPLAELAHRYSRAAPRPVDDEFRELWEKAQIVFRELAGRIEANYTRALALVDQLAADAPDVTKLRQQVPHSTVVLDRFFEGATLEWFEPLREAGYFDAPPPLVYEEDGSVSYVRWPQGQYLVRVAASNPEAVIEVGTALSTDNPEAHEAVVDAALLLPPQQSIRLVPSVQEWLKTPVQWALPFKAQALVVHLVNGGQVDEGLDLLRSLAASVHVARNRGDLVSHMIEELTPEIFPAAGLAGVIQFVELLRDEIVTDERGSGDFSSIWRPQIARSRHRDIRDVLVSSLRDGAAEVVRNHPELIADVISAIEAGGSSVFRRLALHLLTVAPDRDMIVDRLGNPELLLDGDASREYDDLAKDHFSSLSADAKGHLHAVIESGPPFGREDPDFVARWRLEMLRRFPAPLPEVWQQEVDELTQTYGEPSESPVVSEVGFVGPNSPLSLNEMAGMTVDEVSSTRATGKQAKMAGRRQAGKGSVEFCVKLSSQTPPSSLILRGHSPTWTRRMFERSSAGSARPERKRSHFGGRACWNLASKYWAGIAISPGATAAA